MEGLRIGGNDVVALTTDAQGFFFDNRIYKKCVRKIKSVRDHGHVSRTRGYLSYEQADLYTAAWNYPGRPAFNLLTIHFISSCRWKISLPNIAGSCGKQTIRSTHELPHLKTCAKWEIWAVKMTSAVGSPRFSIPDICRANLKRDPTLRSWINSW